MTRPNTPLAALLQQPGRRRFLRTLVVGSAAVGGLGLAGCGGGSDDDDGGNGNATFVYGVASGDPLADRVILWTHVTPAGAAAAEVQWEVASDAGFATIVAQGRASTDASRDGTVKVDATGLAAGTAYWYRFRAGAVVSPVGRTKTLPTGAVAEVRLGVFSCASYPTGFFNAYAHATARGDLDAVLHLGDYLYEYQRGGFASLKAPLLGREVDPPGELVGLSDYRTRYAQYRSDPDVQALHAALPMIAVWDDHEFANDAWSGGAQNHAADEGDWVARKAAAIQAYHEWMPTRVDAPDRIWRGFDFGNLLSLHMLDTRIAGRDEQISALDYVSASGFDATGLQAAIDDPNRQLLGAAQAQWLQGRLQTSTATWQVLGQQVLMGRMNIPAPVATLQVGVGEYAAIVAKSQTAPGTLTPEEIAILGQPSIPYNLDAWDGYGAAREAVLEAARINDRNLVVLAGDTHNAWASDLRDAQGRAVGVEFAVSSVTSPGFEEYLPNELPEQLAESLTELIDPLVWCNTSRRGYMVLSATPAACRADWVFVDTIDERDTTAALARSLQTLPGAAGRQVVEVAA